MKKILLAVVLISISSSSLLLANQDQNSLKDLAVAQMNDYARALNDRGDKEEARRVFGKILKMDPQYAPALAYLHQKPVHRTSAVPSMPVASCCSVPVIAQKATSPNADLEQEIASEDVAINQLNTEVTSHE